ncbi:MAG: translation initiation factor IF-3 [Armatimonadetes bacterium]|nr:translation initiation factor IF-3 [Armatimonadota bacterium]
MINARCLRFPDLRLIGPEGEQVGIIQSRRALQMAEDAGLDLVLVAPNAQPPVCRIVDHGKYKYEQEKRDKDNKHKRKAQEVKGIKLRPSTAGHDLQVLLKNSRKFLEEGDKVRFLVQFKSREIAHPEIAVAKLDWFLKELGDSVQMDKPAGLEGRQMTMVVSPNKKAPAKGLNKDGKQAEDKQDGGEEVQDLGDRQDSAPQSVQQPHVLPQERQPEAPPGERAGTRKR